MSEVIPEGWRLESLASCIAESTAGEWGNEANGDENDIPVLRSTNFTDSGKIDYRNIVYRNIEKRKRIKKALSKGDVLLEKSGGSPAQPVGRVVYFERDTPYLFSNFTQKLVAHDGNDTKYVFYKLLSEYQNGTVLKFQQQTTGIINFQLAEYLAYETLLAPLPEQQKIATILSSVDDVIEKTRAQIDKLKDLKTGMMQELLTKGIGHTEFKGSPVGTVPMTWTIRSLGEVATLSTGGTPDRSMPDYWNGEIPWVKTGEINYSEIFDTEEKITELGLKYSAAKIVPAGAVLMAMYGQGVTRGRVALLGINAAVNQACVAIFPSELLANSFLYYFLTYKYEYLRTLVQEGTQKNLNSKIIKELFVPLPTVTEQQAISKTLGSIDLKLRRQARKVDKLLSLKKALMQDLLTGKVRVKVDNSEVAAA